MTILHETSYLPLSYAKKMVAVMKELQVCILVYNISSSILSHSKEHHYEQV